ncbi:ArsR/SmtB family transcription factor [Kitasatospora sp. P5_F3]
MLDRVRPRGAPGGHAVRGQQLSQRAREGRRVAARGQEQLLGAPKARLLTLLHEPPATTELARRLGVTPGAVSQHLAVLHATRLATRARHGRLVLYTRSPLVDRLLGD